MPSENTDVKIEVDSSATETAPLSSDAGLEKVIRDTFNKSESSTDEPEKKTEDEVVPDTTEAEVKPTETPVVPKAEDKKEPETKVEDKGPIPYERFAEVNKAKVTYEAQLAEAQPRIQGYNSIEQHCYRNNITPEKFQYWMDIAALAEVNPLEAMKQLEPTLTALKSFVGEVLPKELQAAVDSGEITLDWAKKLAASQAQQGFQAQRSQQTAQQQAALQQRAFEQNLVTGLDSWAKNKASNNPDFIPKTDPNAPDGLYELFIHKLNLVAKSAKINSVQDLINTSEEVLKSVETSIGRYRTPVKPTVNVRTANTAASKPTPIKTLDDAIAAAAAKHGLAIAK